MRLFKDYIQDIRSEMDFISDCIRDTTFEDFVNDPKSSRAVIRSLEVIGEAAGKISVDIRAKYSGIPWKNITGLRNKLIHDSNLTFCFRNHSMKAGVNHG